ncbi:hypothetical protein SCFA_1370008 [anaerobic digester metagenome]|jgi:hypothetical protein|uniref:Uncharacterized protein n=1 Tax=anaerobic digester metagenome TaxID=1263854 RepID=A0A485LWU7_9ZZZZ
MPFERELSQGYKHKPCLLPQAVHPRDRASHKAEIEDDHGTYARPARNLHGYLRNLSMDEDFITFTGGCAADHDGIHTFLGITIPPSC